MTLTPLRTSASQPNVYYPDNKASATCANDDWYANIDNPHYTNHYLLTLIYKIQATLNYDCLTYRSKTIVLTLKKSKRKGPFKATNMNENNTVYCAIRKLHKIERPKYTPQQMSSMLKNQIYSHTVTVNLHWI